jgi:hypothetical protein
MDSSLGDIHKFIPGRYELTLVVYQEGEPEYDEPLLGGTRGTLGRSLEEMRTLLGGSEGFLTDPFLGERHALSLAKWADADPITTRCYTRYAFVPAEGHEDAAQRFIQDHLAPRGGEA